MNTSLLKMLKKVYEKTIGILLILLLWEVLPRWGIINSKDLPPFSEVLISIWKLFVTGEIAGHLFISLYRSSTGFLVAVLFALPVGFILGWFKRASRILNPILQFFRNTPSLALYPMFILLLGFGEFSKLAIIFWSTLWPILINTTDGFKSLDPIYIKAARGMGIKSLGLFFKVLFPAAFPSIVTGFRLGATRSIQDQRE